MNDLLPAGWEVRWEETGAPETLRLAPDAIPGDRALSVAFRRDGLAPWGRSGFPLGSIVIVLREFPRLDEIWCLWMMICSERADEARLGTTEWDVVCQYVDDCRHGHWTDRAPPERAVQSVYAAIVQHALRRATPDRESFLENALLLCSHVDKRLRAGASLLDDIVTDHPAFDRHVATLQADQKLYREDVSRGARRIARIDDRGGTREVGLLVLRRPVATQFKLWARRDPDAPMGNGYALMLVELDDVVVLSADPASKLVVGWLAAKLDVLEHEVRGDATAHWYDGKRHDGTLVAAPSGNTKLPFERIVELLSGELQLRRPPDRRRRRVLVAAAGGLVLAGGAIAAVVALRPPPPTHTITNTVVERTPVQADVYAKVAPSTVLLVVHKEIGSGVLIGDGLVLTNNHVVEGGLRPDYGMDVTVELGRFDDQRTMQRGGTKYAGTVVKVDRPRDLALVRIPAPAGLPTVALSATDPKAGRRIFCIGNADIGMLWAMKDGIVSSVGVYSELKGSTSMECAGTPQECEVRRADSKHRLDQKYTGKLFQSTCQLAGGDSGGPVVDDVGELVGLNVLTNEKGATLTNFHIPLATIREFVATAPTEPVHVPPDPRDVNVDTALSYEDLDGDKRFESVFVDVREQPTLLVDLSGSTTPPPGDALTWREVAKRRTDLAVSRDGDRLLAYYDDDGDGQFERVIVQSPTGLQALRMTRENGVAERHPPAALLDGKAAPLAKSILAKLGGK